MQDPQLSSSATSSPPVELIQNAEILYRIFEYAPDAVLLVDREGRIAGVNRQLEQMFGYNREELTGKLVEILIPSRFSERHVGYRSGYIDAPRTRPMGAGISLFGKRKDGTEFPVDIMLSPLEGDGGSLIMSVVRDVTERKRIEAQALRARETYLKEVHHRVKNNLQVISSLLYLQSTYTDDANVKEILQESQGRVKSIALIHEKLYKSPDKAGLDFGEYLRDLVSDLVYTYVVDKELVKVNVSVEDVTLEIDTAIPCGLILNELLSNALKHAFPSGRRGTVDIRLTSAGHKEYDLTVRDDGTGLPPGFDWTTSNSLGLKLVMDLTHQLEGNVTVDTTNGTEFRIHFRELQYKDRN